MGVLVTIEVEVVANMPAVISDPDDRINYSISILKNLERSP